MATKSPERKIYDVLMKATNGGSVPFGYYGPETCRWATQEEMQRFSLKDFPLVHLDEKGDIDRYFTETEAVTIRPKNEPSTRTREGCGSQRNVPGTRGKYPKPNN